MSLAHVQDHWSEQLLQNAQFSDAVAILGPAGERVPFLSALLANVSDPLKTALLGEFKEGKNKQVVLSNVLPAAFHAIMRAAVHLNPNLSPQNVVPTLQASSMYMIEGVADECVRYLEGKINTEDIVTVLSASAALSFALPDDVQRKYWCRILLDSRVVLSAPSFLSAHGSIIIRLVKLEELEVPEEDLWSRLVAWAANAVKTPELLGPFSNVLPAAQGKRLQAQQSDESAKRLKTQHSDEIEQVTAQQTAILQSLAPHVRFTVMTKEFFVDKVRPFLAREESDAIMMFYLLSRLPPKQITSTRLGLNPVEQKQAIQTMADENREEAEKLSLGSAAFKVTPKCRVITVKMDVGVIPTKIDLRFAAEKTLWPGCAIHAPSNVSAKTSINGRVKTISIDTIIPTSILQISAEELRQPFDSYAALVKVDVFGTKTRTAYATDVVNRLNSDLQVVPPLPSELHSSAAAAEKKEKEEEEDE